MPITHTRTRARCGHPRDLERKVARTTSAKKRKEARRCALRAPHGDIADPPGSSRLRRTQVELPRGPIVAGSYHQGPSRRTARPAPSFESQDASGPAAYQEESISRGCGPRGYVLSERTNDQGVICDYYFCRTLSRLPSPPSPFIVNYREQCSHGPTYITLAIELPRIPLFDLT